MATFILREALRALSAAPRFDSANHSRLNFLRGIFFKPADEQQDCGDADARVGDIEGRPPTVARGNELVVEGDLDGDEVDHITL